MKFLADENVDQPIVARLRKDGHSVLSITEKEQITSDEEVIHQANQEKSREGSVAY